MKPAFEKLFGFDSAKHSVRTEILAGLTTFLTMAYILAVNPGIFSALDMPGGAVFTATALAAIVGTLVMAVYAKKPFALAPGMGLNAFFVFTVCLGMGHSWQFALTAVLIEGLLFIILTLTKVRSWLINAIPGTLKKAIGAGLKMSGMYFGSILLMVGMSVALFWYIGSKLSKSKKENDEKKATHYQELIDTVKTDTVFLENVIAAGSACKDRQDIDTAEIYTIKGVPGGMVHKVGSPEIEDVYVIGNESSTKLTMYMVYKLTYQYDESGETFPVYTGVSLSNVDMDENGYMKYDFDVSPVIAGDYVWGGFYDKDQFYRECLFQYDRNGVLMELDLSVLGKEGKS